MQKIYRKYVLTGLTIISFSLLGMKKNNQRPQQQKNPHYTLTVQPYGGYITLDESAKIYLRNDCDMNIKDNVEKVIHFTPINCENENNANNQKTYEFLETLKYNKPISIVPLNLFTEKQSYTIKKDNITITLVSDNNIYEEASFITYNEYSKKFNNQ